MSLHGGAIDEDLSWRAAGTGQRMKETDPDALCGPADVTVVERLARPVIGRSVDPAPARFQDMDDSADHPAVIGTGLAPCIRRQMRRDPRKLRLAEPKMIPIHRTVLSDAVNHKLPEKPTIYGSEP